MDQRSGNSRERWHRLGELANLLALGLAALSIWSWGAGVGDLFVSPGQRPMSPGTAMLLALVGAAVWLTGRWPNDRRVKIGALGTALGMLVVGAWVSRELWSTAAVADVRAPFETGDEPDLAMAPMMSPLSGAALGLIALTLLLRLLPFRETRRASLTSVALVWLVFLGSSAIALSYLSAHPIGYGWLKVPMSLQATVNFVLLSGALILLGPNTRIRSDYRFSGPQVLAIGTATGLALVVGGSGALYLRSEQAKRRTDVRQMLDIVADLKSSLIANWREERLRDAELYARVPAFGKDVREFVDEPASEAARSKATHWLASIKAREDYSYAELFDSSLLHRLSEPAAAATVAPELHEIMRSVLRTGQPLLTDLQEDSHGTDLHLHLICPISLPRTGPEPSSETEKARNTERALVVMHIDPTKFFYPVLDAWPTTSQTAKTLLLRRQGHQLSCLYHVPRPQGAVLSWPMPLASTLGRALGNPAAASPLEYRDRGGETVLAGLRGVEDSPWFLVARADRDEIYATLYHQAFLTLGLTGFVTTAVGLLTFLFWQRKENSRVRYELAGERERRAMADRVQNLIEAHRQQLIELIETTPAGFFALDKNGCFLRVNPAWLKMHGYVRPEEVLGQHYNLTQPEGELTSAGAMLARVLAGERIASVECERRCKDGTISYHSCSLSPVLQEGQITGIQGFLIDLTEHKRNEERIRQLASEQETMLNTVGLGICFARDRRMEWANADFKRQLGYDSVNGLETSTFYASAADHARVGGEAYPALARGEIFTTDIQLRRKDGTVFWSKLSGRAIDPTDASKGSIWAVDDITAEKQAQDELAESKARLRALIDSTKDMLWLVEPKAFGLVVFNGGLLEFFREQHGLQVRLGMRPEDFDAPEAARLWRGLYTRALQEGAFTTEYHSAAGKHDFLLSFNLVRCGAEILGISVFATNITQRKAAEVALARSKTELAAIYNGTPIMMCLVNQDRNVEQVNRAMAEFVGRGEGLEELNRAGGLLGCTNSWLDPRGCGYSRECQGCALRQCVTRTFQTGEPCRLVETRLVLMREGKQQEFWFAISSALVQLEKPRVLVCLEDITRRKQLEAQFLQAQRMEAVGQLAGGVAHDFNNILAALLLHLELLQQRPDLDTDMASCLKELEQGAQRAASLTRQLLLFSRRQVMRTERVDLNDIMAGLIKMLGRLLGEHIRMSFLPSAEPATVEADPGMIEQVIMNLCVNARDAMPEGGRLDVAMERFTFAAADVRRHPDARPGTFICLVVADDGCGMDAATQKRIFEPFFTTKEPGKGTGLGLATVYGITRQHQGWVEVQSAPRQGTTFRVFLPVVEGRAPLTQAPGRFKPPGGKETILLVEDEDRVRSIVKMTLSLLGYDVLEASHGVEALRVWREHGSRVRLLLTDMVMPEGLNGLQLATQLRAMRPDLKVIISSGYSPDLVGGAETPPENTRFLAKPYDPHTLAQSVRECLDEAPEMFLEG